MEDNGKRTSDPAASGKDRPGRGTSERLPTWWAAPVVPEDAPDGTASLVARLEAALFGRGGERHEPDPDSVDEDRRVGAATVGSAIAALRDAILAAEAEGAPGNRVAALHRALDREHSRITAALLERAGDESRELLEHVSHDIRSPLNSVLFLADTLLSEHSGTLNEVQRRQVGVLYTASVTLVNLVNDLIDASRLERRGEIQVSHLSFSVESVLNDVKSLVGPLATHRNAELRFHLETVGPRAGDRQVLSRLLINLITNAVQAVEEEGRVDVTVSEPREGWLRLEVRDDGEGTDVEELREYIEQGSRDMYPLANRRGWTHGLGLMITSHLVEAAQGRIRVESERAEGTRFTVDLPFPLTE